MKLSENMVKNMNNATYIPQVVEKLKEIHPYKIILFGSYAYEDANRDSDIDLLVVTGNEEFPKKLYRKNRDIPYSGS